MHFVDKNTVEKYKKMYPKGTRIELILMDDKQAPPPGTCGTVAFIDNAGTVHMIWDTGSTLGLIPDEDEFEVISKAGDKE